jgi:hypothetical protein
MAEANEPHTLKPVPHGGVMYSGPLIVISDPDDPAVVPTMKPGEKVNVEVLDPPPTDKILQWVDFGAGYGIGPGKQLTYSYMVITAPMARPHIGLPRPRTAYHQMR